VTIQGCRTLALMSTFTRRQLLYRAGTAAAVALAAEGGIASAARGAPTVLVIGGGLAGLSAARSLRHRGHRVRLFEASDRLGGRVWTLRGFLAGGQVSEHGGEFISSEHSAMRGLADRFGLGLENTLRYPAGTRDRYVFGGGRYPLPAAVADWAEVFPIFRAAVHAAGYPTTFDRHTAAGRALDRMTVDEWIETSLPGGLGSRLGALVANSCVGEYGADIDHQSALNVVYLLGFDSRRDFSLAGTDEKFHVRGGNDQVPAALAAGIPAGAIETGAELVALRRRPSGACVCTFARRGGSHFEATADRVVLALPFTMLRRVDLSRAGLSARKLDAIHHLPMGTNAKLHVQFGKRYWYDLGADGTTYADTGYESCWEATTAEPGRRGVLVQYTGGRLGRFPGMPAHAPARPALVRRFLRQLQPVLPGGAAHWNGRAWLDHWAAHPWTHGSYSYWGPGHYTRFAGYEGVPEGTIHFAGEHTSLNFQGYMEGAVRSGRRAARETG